VEDERVTAEQILAEIGIDIERMAQKVADAINKAQAGAIIVGIATTFPTRAGTNHGWDESVNWGIC
jgi:hypothetical protein